MTPSLEDERRALLEQIEASRAAYRRMLSQDPASVAHRRNLGADGGSHSGNAGERALRWMTEHPLWVAAGVSMVVLLWPRAAGAARHAARARASQRHESSAPMRQQGTLRALLTVAALLLRDPARMRAAVRVAQTAWHWMQRRRTSAGPPTSPAFTTSSRQPPP